MCIDENVHTQTPLQAVPSLSAHSSAQHSEMHIKWVVVLAVMQLPCPAMRHYIEERHRCVGQSRRCQDLALCITAASCYCKPSHLLRPRFSHSTPSFFFRPRSGAVTSDRFGANFPRYVAIPSTVSNYYLEVGDGISRILCVLTGSGRNPSTIYDQSM